MIQHAVCRDVPTERMRSSLVNSAKLLWGLGQGASVELALFYKDGLKTRIDLMRNLAFSSEKVEPMTGPGQLMVSDPIEL